MFFPDSRIVAAMSARLRLAVGLAAGQMLGALAAEDVLGELLACLAALLPAVEDPVDEAAGVLAGSVAGVVADRVPGLVRAEDGFPARLIGGVPHPVVVFGVAEQAEQRVQVLAGDRQVLVVAVAHAGRPRCSGTGTSWPHRAHSAASRSASAGSSRALNSPWAA